MSQLSEGGRRIWTNVGSPLVLYDDMTGADALPLSFDLSAGYMFTVAGKSASLRMGCKLTGSIVGFVRISVYSHPTLSSHPTPNTHSATQPLNT